MQSSFASGQTVPLATKNRSTNVAPYDADLTFCREQQHNSKDPTRIIYSIDIIKLLREIDNNNLEALQKITIAGVQARNNLAMWDILFNTCPYRAASACILTAQNNYTPIPLARVVTQANFLDLSRPASRLHLNTVVIGDRIGIAISDPVHKRTHVLIYEIDSISVIRYLRNEETNTSVPLSGANVSLLYALQMDHVNLDQAQMISFTDEPYTAEQTGPFVAGLIDTVSDIKNSYSWKPHFKPVIAQHLKRTIIEEELLKDMPDAKSVEYAEFEAMCRKLYDDARKNRPPRDNTPALQTGDQKGRKQKNHKRPQQVVLPLIQVALVGDAFYVLFNRGEQLVTFNLADVGSQAITELFLTNNDAPSGMISEVPGVLMLSSRFGRNATLRYFTLNF